MEESKEKPVMKEMNIITDKENKIYFKCSLELDELSGKEKLLSFLEDGIKVKKAILSGEAEELGMLENFKRNKPETLKAFLGGKEYDANIMSAEAELKKVLAEYRSGTRKNVTCILELPKECKYASEFSKVKQIFCVRGNGKQTVIPSQFVKNVIVPQKEGYELWESPNFDPEFVVENGIYDQKEIAKEIHKIDPIKASVEELESVVKLVKKEYIATGDVETFQGHLEELKKIFKVRREAQGIVEKKEVVEEARPIPQEQALVVYEEKKGFFGTLFKKLKKLFFGNALQREKGN